MKKPINKKQFVIQTLRRASYRWLYRTEALRKARVSRGQYQCAMCGPEKSYDRHSIAVDHRDPVVDPNKGWTNWDDYIERMFCEESGFDILCNEHHDQKSIGENKVRKQTRAEANAARKEVRTKKKKKDPKTNKHTGQSLDDFLVECGIKLPEDDI